MNEKNINDNPKKFFSSIPAFDEKLKDLRTNLLNAVADVNITLPLLKFIIRKNF